jgi:hypothetical protein
VNARRQGELTLGGVERVAHAAEQRDVGQRHIGLEMRCELVGEHGGNLGRVGLCCCAGSARRPLLRGPGERERVARQLSRERRLREDDPIARLEGLDHRTELRGGPGEPRVAERHHGFAEHERLRRAQPGASARDVAAHGEPVVGDLEQGTVRRRSNRQMKARLGRPDAREDLAAVADADSVTDVVPRRPSRRCCALGPCGAVAHSPTLSFLVGVSISLRVDTIFRRFSAHRTVPLR